MAGRAFFSTPSPIQIRHSTSLRVGVECPSYAWIMNLELTDEQAAALETELRHIIDDDRYPLSPRIRTLREILHRLRPEPIREPLPPIRHYEPPRAARYRRRQ
jgi:hypothetical protein